MDHIIIKEDNTKEWIGFFKCKNCSRIYAFPIGNLAHAHKMTFVNPCVCSGDPDIKMITDFIGYKKNPNYIKEEDIQM